MGGQFTITGDLWHGSFWLLAANHSNMPNSVSKFSESAKGFSKSPLGIIALFIVLVYGFASMAVGFGQHLAEHVVPLIYFLVSFPVLVLASFLWLVAKHHKKIYGPSDFAEEENFLKYIQQGYKSGYMVGVASNKATDDPDEVQERSGSSFAPQRHLPKPEDFVMPALGDVSGKQILWVDDNPAFIQNEKEAFESLGIKVTVATTTEEAMRYIQRNSDAFDLIISDMERGGAGMEGYALLERLRNAGRQTPVYFYVSTVTGDQRQMTYARGAQGMTTKASELFNMVMSHFLH